MKRTTIDDLMEMKIKDVLNEFCILYSPECDYNYGIGRWDDANQIYEEFDLEDQYCFSGDSLIPLDYNFFEGEEVLTIDDMREIMDKLGIIKKQSCPICGSEDYHLDYSDLCILCNDCGYKECEKEESSNKEVL